MTGRWIWVSIPNATFAVQTAGGRVCQAPPIARWVQGKDEVVVADHFRRQGAQFADLTDGVETESLWRVVMPLTGPAPSDGELENLVLALPKFATVRVDDATDVLTAVFPAPGPGIASETFRQAAYSTLGDGYGQGSLRVQLDNDRL